MAGEAPEACRGRFATRGVRGSRVQAPLRGRQRSGEKFPSSCRPLHAGRGQRATRRKPGRAARARRRATPDASGGELPPALRGLDHVRARRADTTENERLRRCDHRRRPPRRSGEPRSEPAPCPAPGPHIPDRLDQDPFFCDYLPRIRQRADYHPAFTDWILRYPERTGHPSDRIVSYEAFVVEQDSPPPGETNARNVRTTSFIKWPRR